jgi:hypothetical protein
MVSDLPQEIPRGSKRHFGTSGTEYTGAFDELGVSDFHSPTVANMKSRLPAEEDPPAKGTRPELSGQALIDQEQLDKMAERNHEWQRPVDPPEESSKPEE